MLPSHNSVGQARGFVFTNQSSREAGLFATTSQPMNELFMHQLQGNYYATTQLVKALREMAGKVTEKQPKQGFLSLPDESGCLSSRRCSG